MGQPLVPMKPEGEGDADGGFKAWAERRRDEVQGGRVDAERTVSDAK